MCSLRMKKSFRRKKKKINIFILKEIQITILVSTAYVSKAKKLEVIYFKWQKALQEEVIV